MGALLLVEDEAILRESLATLLRAWGHDVATAPDGEAALRLLADRAYDLVLTDLVMPGLDGMAVLDAARRLAPAPEVVIISAYSDVPAAVEAVKAGAATCLRKPVNSDELKITVARLLAQRVQRDELARLRVAARHTGVMVGQDPALLALLATVDRVADSPSTVLVLGESGTGKELVARALHERGRRKGRRFVALSCGSLPEPLLESELFGYEPGAFTGAVKAKPGLFEIAAGGTLFLDEIAEAPPGVQVKLLRALQERVVRRLGGTSDIPCDVRVVCATNRDLTALTAGHGFREDLLYRIRVITLTLPPLRERADDLPLLLEHFLIKYNLVLGRRVRGFTDAAQAALARHAWPGNIRELENAVERAVNLARDQFIDCDDLPATVTAAAIAAPPAVTTASYQDAKAVVLEQFERDYFTGLLQRSGGSITRAAELAGMYRKNLYDKLKRLNIAFRDENR